MKWEKILISIFFVGIILTGSFRTILAEEKISTDSSFEISEEMVGNKVFSWEDWDGSKKEFGEIKVTTVNGVKKVEWEGNQVYSIKLTLDEKEIYIHASNYIGILKADNLQKYKIAKIQNLQHYFYINQINGLGFITSNCKYIVIYSENKIYFVYMDSGEINNIIYCQGNNIKGFSITKDSKFLIYKTVRLFPHTDELINDVTGISINNQKELFFKEFTTEHSFSSKNKYDCLISDSKYLITSKSEVFDIEKSRLVVKLKIPQKEKILKYSFNESNNVLLVSFSKYVNMYEIKNWNLIKTYKLDGKIIKKDFINIKNIRDYEIITLNRNDSFSDVILYDAKNNNIECVVKKQKDDLENLTVLNNNQIAIVKDNKIEIFDINNYFNGN